MRVFHIFKGIEAQVLQVLFPPDSRQIQGEP